MQPGRPRERIIRRAIPEPEKIVVRERRHAPPPIRAPLLLALTLVAAVLVGSLILSLPMANQTDEFTPYTIALFTAASAVCVTGLVVVDTGTYWSPFGQVMILLLIQAGGLGFMTASTFLLILIGRRVGLTERLLLDAPQRLGQSWGLLWLARQVLLLTVILEGIGFLVLTARFSQLFPLDTALWMGLFHSVSAFNNAGFDIVGDFRSLTPYNGDAVITLTVISLVIAGGIGYYLLMDIWYQRQYKRFLLDTKLVISITAALLAIGTVSLFVLEFDNEATLGPMTAPHKLLNAFFMAATPRSGGFSTVEVASMTPGALLIIMGLMYIGGGAGSTAGGIKVNTMGVITSAVVSSIRGRRYVTAFGREIPTPEVIRALSVALVFMGLIFILTLALTIVEDIPLVPLLFEATSAIGIVGLSMGATPELSPLGRLMVTVAIYIGRIGPLTVGLALAERRRPELHRYPEASVKIG